MSQSSTVRAAEGRAARHSPVLSVVVPVHQGGEHLRRVLIALTRSTLPRGSWELIVVDDASTDASAQIAAGHADLVVRLTGHPRGPAYARNRGFEVSRGDLVAFVDADVLVRPDALPRMIAAIDEDPAVGAVIGAYDSRRTSGRLLTEYRNMLRHVEHRHDVGDTDAFAAGLALVRRTAFLRAGMFDEWRFPRPQAEALELGDRLLTRGYRILRRLDAQATHLKKWTLRHWIRIDLLDRGMSIARLDQFPGIRSRADRLYLATPFDALLAWTVLIAGGTGLLLRSAPLAVLGSAAVLALVLHNARLFATLARARGIMFATAAVPLHLVTCAVRGVASAAGRILYHAVGEPQPGPVIQAFAEVGVRTWPPVPARPPVLRNDAAPPSTNGNGSVPGASIRVGN